MDPPNVFIDAVDGLLHCAMTAPNGSYDRPCCCLALIWHPILSWQLPTRVHAVYPDSWWIFQMYLKMQLTDCSMAPWQLWMVQMTHLDVVLPWHDISFSVDNCQLGRRLSTTIRWWILQMSSKMQLMGYYRAPWWLWMVQLTYPDIVLP